MADTTFLKDNLVGFVPTESAGEIMKDVARGSSVLRLSKVEPMISDKKKFSIMTEGAGAYWVGETERIQTSKATWIFPEMEAKKLAVIIPVTKEKMNDTTINVFEELKPTIAEASYKAIDAACLFGTNSPFAKSIYGVANTLGNVVELEANGADKLDLDVSDVMALVEDAGIDVNGFIGHYGLKNTLRKLRDGNGNQLYVGGVDQSELYSNPIEFARNGAFASRYNDFMRHPNEDSLVCYDELLMATASSHKRCKRKITYPQLMAIGKLKLYQTVRLYLKY